MLLCIWVFSFDFGILFLKSIISEFCGLKKVKYTITFTEKRSKLPACVINLLEIMIFCFYMFEFGMTSYSRLMFFRFSLLNCKVATFFFKMVIGKDGLRRGIMRGGFWLH